jgi:hypothetical protein
MLSNNMDKDQELTKVPASQADCEPVSEAQIDAALEGSFPASDPLPWTLGTVPCPDPEDEPTSSSESEAE